MESKIVLMIVSIHQEPQQLTELDAQILMAMVTQILMAHGPQPTVQTLSSMSLLNGMTKMGMVTEITLLDSSQMLVLLMRAHQHQTDLVVPMVIMTGTRNPMVDGLLLMAQIHVHPCLVVLIRTGLVAQILMAMDTQTPMVDGQSLMAQMSGQMMQHSGQMMMMMDTVIIHLGPMAMLAQEMKDTQIKTDLAARTTMVTAIQTLVQDGLSPTVRMLSSMSLLNGLTKMVMATETMLAE